MGYCLKGAGDVANTGEHLPATHDTFDPCHRINCTQERSSVIRALGMGMKTGGSGVHGHPVGAQGQPEICDSSPKTNRARHEAQLLKTLTARTKDLSLMPGTDMRWQQRMDPCKLCAMAFVPPPTHTHTRLQTQSSNVIKQTRTSNENRARGCIAFLIQGLMYSRECHLHSQNRELKKNTREGG